MAPRRERFVACNREQPRRERRARLERGSVAPYVEKHFTQEVLGQGFIDYETQQPPINLHPIPCEERSHSRLVALQRSVWSAFYRKNSRKPLPTQATQRPLLRGC